MRDFYNYKKRKAKRGKRSRILALFAVIILFLFVFIARSNISQLVLESLKTGSLGIVNGKVKVKNQLIKFNPISGPILNPLMGLSPWASVKEIKQPHTLVYADLTWRDFEPQEGVFDFTAFEKKQQLDRWRGEGKRVVFRFVADFPGRDSHMDIPDWLFEKINGDGDSYDNEYGKGFSPNYSNPLFIKYHQLALKALGDRYGKDGFFAFIELGSLGHWGEWHAYEDLRQLPSENIRDIYVHDYINAFPGIHLLMRRPFTITRDLGLGLYNDMTGSVEDTNTWLDWISNGGDYLPNEKNSLVPMPDGWEKAPIGGEQAPTMSFEEVYGTNLETTLMLLIDSHATFIGPGGPYKVETTSPLQDGIDQVLSTIGYRLYIENVEMPFVVMSMEDIHIRFVFSNGGIAPFYYEWPTSVYIFNENGETIGTYPLSMDIRKVLPGKLYEFPFTMSVGTLENGKYFVGFAIIDPLTGRPGVKLANENIRDDLIQEIGSFEVKR
ncbi:MAG: DUF4832 domain-containing protein [Chloroflexi bacterium]|nr:DUF4832 domain-containing protein [Chloroflexota bacterium]